MSAPNRRWPGLASDGRTPLPTTDEQAFAAGLLKVDVGGQIVYRSSVDARELVETSGGIILAWPPGTVGAA